MGASAETRSDVASLESDIATLSATEEEVLQAFASGFSRGEIAALLHLSSRTVGHALTVAKEKLGARSLVHAAVMFALYVSLD